MKKGMKFLAVLMMLFVFGCSSGTGDTNNAENTSVDAPDANDNEGADTTENHEGHPR